VIATIAVNLAAEHQPVLGSVLAVVVLGGAVAWGLARLWERRQGRRPATERDETHRSRRQGTPEDRSWP
jgi:hypothetical protein